MVVMTGSLCQRIQAVGLILWIDQNTFATSLLEKVFKKKDLPFYTLSEASDFVYLVDDLNPVLIVVDTKTALSHLESFKTQYEASQKLRSLPFVWVDGESHDLGFVQNVVGKIERPFDPFEIPEKLKNILGTH